jgi:O-antigen biosynthesis protein
MARRVRVVDIEISRPIETIEPLDEYDAVQGLVRLHGAPIGWIAVPVVDGSFGRAALKDAILTRHATPIIRHLLRDSLAAPRPTDLSIAELVSMRCPAYTGTFPSVTVAVCTRDRTDSLRQCLEALIGLDYAPLDLLVVDNAPEDAATARLVETHFPQIRYVCEPRPGLDWARNRAISEARGEIIAFTDDDVIVDRGWVRALATVFAENPEVMAVTGLVIPYELETHAQILFEQYGGFGRGFERRWYRVDTLGGEKAAIRHGGAGKFGTGANMAYRRLLFDRIGGFDPALDVGTATGGGGDLEMFFRVLKEGYTLVYESAALVRHRHRREYAQLRTQLTNNGIGFYSYLVRSALAYPDERLPFIRLGLWWFWRWNIRRLLISVIQPRRFPRDLILAELRGSFAGLVRYAQARREVARIVASYGRPAHATAALASAAQ